MVDYPMIEEAEIASVQSYDANDPEQVNQAKKGAGRKKRIHLDAVANILASPNGREWYYRLLIACDTYRTCFVFDDQGGRKSAFREGKQFVGLQLIADARKASPDLYDKMLRECEDKKLPPLFPTIGLVDG